MGRISADTVAAFRAALADPTVVDRYWSHVRRTKEPDRCWLWTGAIAGKGHGRFQVGDTYVEVPDRPRRRRTFVVIAHRFGFAVAYGLDTLLDTPLVSHRCDNPLCQLPDHWRASNHRANGQEYAHRRAIVRSSLADTRGARGRAAAIRDAARAGGDTAVLSWPACRRCTVTNSICSTLADGSIRPGQPADVDASVGDTV